MNPAISVYAPTHLDPMDSYGLIGCELVRHISRMNYPVNAIALGNPRHTNQDEELLKITSKPIIPCRGGILLGYPTTYRKYGALSELSPRIALTMFESSKIPPWWVEELNSCDAIIVPSEFCRQSFKECGVERDIYLFPLGILDVYQPVKRNPEGIFTFLCFMDRGKRKGGITAFDAFVQEFGDDPNVRLIIKHRYIKPEKRPDLRIPNVVTIFEDYTYEQLNELYLNCHCLINPNKGEGFGLIPREFSATGGISLVTNWGGTAEGIDNWGYPLDYTLSAATWPGYKKFQGVDLGVWADPDIADLRRKMRDVYDNKELLLDYSFIKGKMARNSYSWSDFSRRVLNLYRSLSHGIKSRTGS